MNVNKTLENLDKVVVIQLDVSLWEARTNLSEHDLLDVDKNKLPPKETTNLGSKYIFPRDRLNPPRNGKKAAERYLDEIGLKFGRGPVYAISRSLLTEVARKLDEFGVEFNGYVSGELSTHYDKWFNEFVGSQKQAWWRERLVSAKKPRDEALKGFSWDYQVIPLGFVDDPENLGVNRGLEKKVNGLSGQLFDEIADKASKVISDGVFNKDKVRSKSLTHFYQIRKKMEALSFLDARIHPLIQHIDNALDAVASSTQIEGKDLSMLVGLMSMLADADRMKTIGLAAINNVETSVESEHAVPDIDSTKPVADVVDINESAAESVPDNDPSKSESVFDHMGSTDDDMDAATWF